MSIGRQVGLQGLVTPFREAVIWLEYRLLESGIYMQRWETLRTEERQKYLFKKGSSKAKPGSSPHGYGMAVDYCLDTDKVEVGRRTWKSKNGIERMVPFAWDCESDLAREHWLKFGMCVRSLGLVWGGDFGEDGSNDSDIGWDYPHVEWKPWRLFRGKRKKNA